jgi:hypothetical protein
MVVVGLGREARGYQFKLEPDSKMVHVATNFGVRNPLGPPGSGSVEANKYQNRIDPNPDPHFSEMLLYLPLFVLNLLHTGSFTIFLNFLLLIQK